MKDAKDKDLVFKPGGIVSGHDYFKNGSTLNKNKSMKITEYEDGSVLIQHNGTELYYTKESKENLMKLCRGNK